MCEYQEVFRRYEKKYLLKEQTYRLLIDRAGLGVNEGSMFGEQGRGWMRFNIASPRRVIERAMDRLYRAAAAEGLAGPAIRNR